MLKICPGDGSEGKSQNGIWPAGPERKQTKQEKGNAVAVYISLYK